MTAGRSGSGSTHGHGGRGGGGTTRRLRIPPWWVPASALVLAVAIDLWYGQEASLVVPVVFAPFASAALDGPRRTAAFAVAAVGAAIGLGWPDGTVGTSPHYVAVFAVATGGAMSVWLASQRVRSQGAVRELQRVVDATQLAILHPLPERVRNIRLVGRYVSADTAARVGGDFYDVVDSPYGVRALVGDVRGKGVDAVRLAAVLLGEFRARAYTEAALVDVVSAVDAAGARHVASGYAEDFATAAFAEIDGDRASLVLCGHPRPLLMRDGDVTALSAPASLPLCLGDAPPVATPLRLLPGDRVLFFSDGAFEGRNAAGQEFDLARSVRAHCARELDDFVSRVFADLERHVPGGLDDDVVLVAIEVQQVSREPLAARG